jgi:hypothetical protein
LRAEFTFSAEARKISFDCKPAYRRTQVFQDVRLGRGNRLAVAVLFLRAKGIPKATFMLGNGVTESERSYEARAVIYSLQQNYINFEHIHRIFFC